MKRLGVNIDHIATLRNARGEVHPSPLKAAKLAIKYGADSITVHLREDRRHIHDDDAYRIVKLSKVPVNLECSINSEIIDISISSIALKLKKAKILEHIAEKEIKLKVPQNTKNNQSFRVKGMGAMNRKTKVRGDLYLKANIVRTVNHRHIVWYLTVIYDK